MPPHQTPHDGTNRALTVQPLLGGVGLDVGLGVGLGDGLPIGEPDGDGDGLGDCVVGSVGLGIGPTTGAPAAVGPPLGGVSTGTRRRCGRRQLIRNCGPATPASCDTRSTVAVLDVGDSDMLTRAFGRTSFVTSMVAVRLFGRTCARTTGAERCGALRLFNACSLHEVAATLLTCNALGSDCHAWTTSSARAMFAPAGIP